MGNRTVFEVGGRGRPPRRAIYCSRHCQGVATAKNLPIGRGSHAPRPRKNLDTLHNDEWLRARYLDERLTTTDIARMVSCSVPSVLWALRKFDIPVRSISEAKRGRPNNTDWTPEMREALAVQFRGERGTNYGKPSPRRHPVNWHPDPKVRAVRAKRLWKYGLDAVAYDAMVEAQKGVCLTCGKPEGKRRADGTMFTLSVDHSHVTGKVRGLLCNNCNAAIGLVGENLDTLRAMVAYLEAHQAA